MNPPLAKAEPIRDGGVIIYLRKEKKIVVQFSIQRRLRICKRTNFVDTKDRE